MTREDPWVADLTRSGRESAGQHGWYVHFLNTWECTNTDSARDFAERFASITGEICVSDIGDEHFASIDAIGLVLSGKPTATFAFDCWSRVDTHGRRYATSHGSDGRNESWIVPADCEIVAVVYDDRSRANVKKGFAAARLLAKPFGVEIILGLSSIGLDYSSPAEFPAEADDYDEWLDYDVA